MVARARCPVWALVKLDVPILTTNVLAEGVLAEGVSAGGLVVGVLADGGEDIG